MLNDDKKEKLNIEENGGGVCHGGTLSGDQYLYRGVRGGHSPGYLRRSKRSAEVLLQNSTQNSACTCHYSDGNFLLTGMCQCIFASIYLNSGSNCPSNKQSRALWSYQFFFCVCSLCFVIYILYYIHGQLIKQPKI